MYWPPKEFQMPLPVTERLHPAAIGLDMLSSPVVLEHLLAAQVQAVRVVASALPQIERAAALMAQALNGGGRLAYVGAGSSALMAMADGLELGGTFGVDPSRVLLLMAGGLPSDARMPGNTEDDEAAGAKEAQALRSGDLVIAVAASGRTPYVLGAAKAAQELGTNVIAIANVKDAAIFSFADITICLPTPPEVVAGSTRLGAGTAQKVALNLMSTLMGIQLGQVHDGMMVGLIADNAKLRARAVNTVATIASVSEKTAALALDLVQGAIKPAVLVALGQMPEQAHALLKDTQGNLRAALALIDKSGSTGKQP
jgi:N-acetylmuramic acid 6-phosphate etherase